MVDETAGLQGTPGRSDEEIKVGDVVYLRSGGPAMSVVSLGKNRAPEGASDQTELEMAGCEWFSPLPGGGCWSQDTTRDAFPIVTLTKTCPAL